MSELSDERSAEAVAAIERYQIDRYGVTIPELAPDEALDALAPTLARWLAKERRDLAAKVEALCDEADGSASDDADVRDEIGEAWVKVRELRNLLADAQTPATSHAAGSEAPNGASVDAEMRDGGAGL